MAGYGVQELVLLARNEGLEADGRAPEGATISELDQSASTDERALAADRAPVDDRGDDR